MSAPEFTVDIFQNEYLAAGAREVNAIVTVTSAGCTAGASEATVSAAEIIIVDCSGSMAEPMEKMLTARVSLILNTASGLQTLGQGLVRAIWTGDEEMSTRINRHVAHYTGQAELAQAIQDGLEARKAGDEDAAAAGLGRAVALAQQSGNQDTASLLAKVVDVIDPATGTVRLKAKVADADEMALDTRSSKTVRIKK